MKQTVDARISYRKMRTRENSGQTLEARALFERIRNFQNSSGNSQITGTRHASELLEALRQAESIIHIHPCEDGVGAHEGVNFEEEIGGNLASLRGVGETPSGTWGTWGAWLLVIAQGYVAIASSCKDQDDLVRVNAEKKASATFQRAAAVYDSRAHSGSADVGLSSSLFDLGCLIAKYHYEAAVGLIGCEATAPVVQRRSLHHCSEAVRHGEYALECSTSAGTSGESPYLGSLESTIEIRTMLHHVRVIQADCMVAAGMLVDASRVLGMLPDWSKAKEHTLWYSEELLVRMRLYVGSDMSDAFDGTLRELGLLLRAAGPDVFRPEDRVFLAKRLGGVLEGMMRRFDGRIGSERGHSLDAVLFFVKVAPDEGIEALLGVVLEGLRGENDKANIALEGYLWAEFLCDIMVMGNVCGLVRTRGRDVVDVVSVFQIAASRVFVVGGVDMSIRFWQMVMQYGPESQKQWGFAMLYALQVYKTYVLGDGEDGQVGKSYCALDEATKAHPFVMVVRLFHLKEKNGERGENGLEAEGGEDRKAALTGLLKDIASSAETNAPAWTKEYVLAVHELYDNVLRLDEGSAEGVLERFLQMDHHWAAVDAMATDAHAAAADADRRYEDLHSIHARDCTGDLLRKTVSALHVVMVSVNEHPDDCQQKLWDVGMRLAKTGLKLVERDDCEYKDVRHVLEDLHGRLCLLSCNAQLDALLLAEATNGAMQVAGGLDAIRHDLEGLLHTDGIIQLPIKLVAFRYALLSGSFEMLNPGDFPGILQQTGSDECFVELVCVHLRARRNGSLDQYLEIFQYVVDNIDGGLEAMLLSLALGGGAVGTNTAYRVYAMAMRHLDNVPTALGEAIMATNEITPFLAAKVCMIQPHLAGFICDWNEHGEDDESEAGDGDEDEENVEGAGIADNAEDEEEDTKPGQSEEDEIEEFTTKSDPPPSPSLDEIESPPTATRKRKLSAAGHVISDLINDLDPSEGLDVQARRGTSHDERQERAAPWINWIKRVFSP